MRSSNTQQPLRFTGGIRPGIRSGQLPPVFAARFCEIEKAADLEPGSVLLSLLGIAEDWWSCDDSGLTDWISEGWKLSDPQGVKQNLRALQAKWRDEDAREEGEGERSPAEEAEHATILAKVIADDRETNERAKRAAVAQRAPL